MLISYTHKFIFFHVPKVAGLSIREALQDYAQEPEHFKIRRPSKMVDGSPNPFYEIWQTILLHATTQDAQKELSEEVYDNFYKFAFVRNPWDWQVSMYHFILKETSHRNHRIVKTMRGFEDYIEWIMTTKKPYARGATKFQYEMLTDADGKILLDFIGRYENLKQDFSHVCQILNIEAPLPQLNRTVHRDYRTYYTEKTKNRVADYFRKDIELFGYRFGDYDITQETL